MARDKRDHAEQGDVLVDDQERHRHLWEVVGGGFIQRPRALRSRRCAPIPHSIDRVRGPSVLSRACLTDARTFRGGNHLREGLLFHIRATVAGNKKGWVLGLFRKKPAIEPDERRASRRMRVDCPASFTMPRGEHHGRLSDLSVEGARFELDRPPPQGISGMLAIGDFQAFCKVQWVSETACGLAFERSIPAGLVAQLAAERETHNGPAADFGNIPIGQKRTQRFASAGG